MKKGDKVRFKRGSPEPDKWKVPRDAIGTVLASYRVEASSFRPAAHWVDVEFAPHGIVWGLRAR